jgi:predicted ATPase
LLLNDPEPAPFICIEEPENSLYHKLLETLASEFREHATGKKGASQIFITTHQPYFIDALDLVDGEAQSLDPKSTFNPSL